MGVGVAVAATVGVMVGVGVAVAVTVGLKVAVRVAVGVNVLVAVAVLVMTDGCEVGKTSFNPAGCGVRTGSTVPVVCPKIAVLVAVGVNSLSCTELFI